MVIADSGHWLYVWISFWFQKVHINLNLKNKITKKYYNPPNFHLPMRKNLHSSILLQMWCKISLVIGDGRLYSRSAYLRLITLAHLTFFNDTMLSAFHLRHGLT